jgi:hypothetical protein
MIMDTLKSKDGERLIAIPNVESVVTLLFRSSVRHTGVVLT